MALVLKKQDPLVLSERWEEFDSSTRIKLRGIDNDQYQVAVGRMRRIVDGFDVKAAGEPIALDGERSFYQLQAGALARYVVLDWDGVLDEDGEAVPYSIEAATQLLIANVEFFMWVVKNATELAAERNKKTEETVGKPRRGGSGKKSGETPQESAD
jgi:hypothetical protein